MRHWRNLKLLGILSVHVVAQQERTPSKLRTAHLDRAGKVLVEVTTLDHDIPPDRVESQPALRSERSTKPKPPPTDRTTGRRRSVRPASPPAGIACIAWNRSAGIRRGGIDSRLQPC